MKRHPALQDLSRDHFQVLVRCQQFRRMLARNAPKDEIKTAVLDFLRFFETDMSPHFQEEDELVVPAALSTDHAPLRSVAKAIREEHVSLRHRIAGLATALNEPARLDDVLSGLEVDLTRHVRQEEEELFEGVQDHLDQASLEELGRRSAAFRARHRSPEACARPNRA